MNKRLRIHPTTKDVQLSPHFVGFLLARFVK